MTKSSCILLLGVLSVLFATTSCKKQTYEASICRSSSWLAKDTILVNDSVYFYYCNLLAPADVKCTWDFGDGTKVIGQTATHAWTSSGNYLVTLTVDNYGKVSSTSITITVTSAIGPDYVGNFQAEATIVKISPTDTTNLNTNYLVSITSNSDTSIIFQNVLNDGNQVSGTVNGNNIFIPIQVISSDTIFGNGSLTANQNRISLSINKNGLINKEIYLLGLTRH
jgi:PKD repeat protein